MKSEDVESSLDREGGEDSAVGDIGLETSRE